MKLLPTIFLSWLERTVKNHREILLSHLKTLTLPKDFTTTKIKTHICFYACKYGLFSKDFTNAKSRTKRTKWPKPVKVKTTYKFFPIKLNYQHLLFGISLEFVLLSRARMTNRTGNRQSDKSVLSLSRKQALAHRVTHLTHTVGTFH